MSITQRRNIAPIEEMENEDAGRISFEYCDSYPDRVWIRTDASGSEFMAAHYSAAEFEQLAQEFLHLREE